MKKSILFLLLTGFVFSYTFAQDEATKEPESFKVTAFESNYQVDDQTTVVYDKKTLGIAIQHKFGTIDNGVSDLFGIYGAGRNIRLAMEYVPFKNLQIGAGISKVNMITDLNAKYSILQQTSDNKMPVGLAIYGVIGMDGRGAQNFETGKVVDTKGETMPVDIVFTDKISYFSQVIVSRKFTEWLSYTLDLYKTEIYRVKGILCFENEPYEYILQGVGGSFELVEGDLIFNLTHSLVVFIGESMPILKF